MKDISFYDNVLSASLDVNTAFIVGVNPELVDTAEVLVGCYTHKLITILPKEVLERNKKMISYLRQINKAMYELAVDFIVYTDCEKKPSGISFRDCADEDFIQVFSDTWGLTNDEQETTVVVSSNPNVSLPPHTLEYFISFEKRNSACEQPKVLGTKLPKKFTIYY